MNPALVQLAIEELPAFIALFRHKVAQDVTSDEVIAILEHVFTDSKARGEVLKAALEAEIAAKPPQA